jgi:hypothetical protein
MGFSILDWGLGQPAGRLDSQSKIENPKSKIA